MNNNFSTQLAIPKLRYHFLDKMYQILFWIAYRLKLLYNIFVCPDAHGVYIAVWASGKILIIKNSYKSCFTVPCGGINKNEIAEQSAIRELYEEVKIKVSLTDLIYVGSYLSDYEFMVDHIHLYEVNLLDIPNFQTDNREVVWAGFEDPKIIIKKDLFPVVRYYLNKKIENKLNEIK